ncbi:MAG: NAD(P)H-hydrate dehydratase, partial [Bdellovibrionales bacterium]|nr:NAD(P)H-hydrate dehydratase [Bdellovibrionales bacterium]
MRVVDINEMRAVESQTYELYGLTEELIIENVGVRGASIIEDEFKVFNTLRSIPNHLQEIIFFIGKGNNGADGLCLARHLQNNGYSVRAFMIFPDLKYSEQLEKQVKMAEAFGVKICDIENANQIDSFFSQVHDHHFVVDSILGTGIRLPISDYLFDIINIVNHYSSYVISIDIPSGVTGSEGAISSAAIQANLTLAIGMPKTGHYISSGAIHSGIIKVLESGFPKELTISGNKKLLDQESINLIKNDRDKFAHKNNFGHCLVIGGSQGMTGALIMASTAALKVGTGLVTAVTWPESYLELTSRVPCEIMTGVIPQEDSEISAILKDLNKYNSIIVGPGLGQSERTREVVLNIIRHFGGNLILDADAINVLNLNEDLPLLETRKGPMVLTPHIGEFSRFAGLSSQEVLEQPLENLKLIVDRTNCSIILKDACTFLGFPNGEIYVNYSPNDGLASGGSGDVLAGMIGGYLAQYSQNTNKKQIFK